MLSLRGAHRGAHSSTGTCSGVRVSRPARWTAPHALGLHRASWGAPGVPPAQSRGLHTKHVALSRAGRLVRRGPRWMDEQQFTPADVWFCVIPATEWVPVHGLSQSL